MQRQASRGDITEARCLMVRAAYQSRNGCDRKPWELYRLTVGARMAHMVADHLAEVIGPTVERENFTAHAERAIAYHDQALQRQQQERDGERE